MNFAQTKAKSDEWYTPENAVRPILKYLKPNSIIWCPFDTKESNFPKLLKEAGHTVINTHIENGQDFFNLNVECDYIISNPPYSLKNKIYKRLFELNKPFAMLMNCNGIFDSKERWELFRNNEFSLIFLSGRVNYMKVYGIEEKSSPPFQSAYVCSKLTEEKILFEDRVV